ncbi:hypothetical protein [Thermoplasma sp.]|uniref:hypothetical protein n=1 Tax=Thermoplasma sp. TaxID=1973142 RepID=UPI002635C95B|nr:hypothetical protein [Thermoplasma sp.]
MNIAMYGLYGIYHYGKISKKAPTFSEEMNWEKYINAGLIVCMESPVDKSFEEGMQDTSIQKPVEYWFGMPPQSFPSIVGKKHIQIACRQGCMQAKH